jgi:hypothetical protein
LIPWRLTQLLPLFCPYISSCMPRPDDQADLIILAIFG